jgi:glycosyltransferase involved in cell wall biosynthesis
VHVTPFNALMWNSRRTPTRIVEHGVIVPEDVRYHGDKPSGLVVVNHLARRGRRLGGDVYTRVREQVPLELVGMGAEEMPGGIGEVQHARLPAFIANYRFLFNPIRYTSLGLAVIEAMMIGMPIVALATTEMATVIRNGESGYADTHIPTLIERMRDLIADPGHARLLGQGARRYAMQRFNIRRFVDDWNATFRYVTE